VHRMGTHEVAVLDRPEKRFGIGGRITIGRIGRE